MSSIHELENFRFRIADDEVVLFKNADPCFTVIDADTDLFYIAVAEASGDFSRFDRAVEQAEKRALEDKCLSEKRLDLIYMTCLPWVDFSELLQPIFINAADSIPRLAWGKFKKAGNRVEMPFTVTGHHGFIDGIHIARLIESVGRKIEEFAEEMGV
jgi:Chloramphenicol O-acetyltransferase